MIKIIITDFGSYRYAHSSNIIDDRQDAFDNFKVLPTFWYNLLLVKLVHQSDLRTVIKLYSA